MKSLWGGEGVETSVTMFDEGVRGDSKSDITVMKWNLSTVDV